MTAQSLCFCCSGKYLNVPFSMILICIFMVNPFTQLLLIAHKYILQLLCCFVRCLWQWDTAICKGRVPGEIFRTFQTLCTPFWLIIWHIYHTWNLPTLILCDAEKLCKRKIKKATLSRYLTSWLIAGIQVWWWECRTSSSSIKLKKMFRLNVILMTRALSLRREEKQLNLPSFKKRKCVCPLI